MNDETVWSGPEAAKANESLDRRARQRAAQAAAMLELTPEAVAAEEERQRVNAANEMTNEVPTDDDNFELDDVDGNHTPQSLSEKLAAAAQEVLDVDGVEDAGGDIPYAVGRMHLQWALMDAEEGDGYELALQVQVDEQYPSGVVLEISNQMLDRWNGPGLQNVDGEARFASGLVEKAIELSAYETGNGLIYALRQLMQARLPVEAPDYSAFQEGDFEDEPTRTAVGDADEPDLPELSE